MLSNLIDDKGCRIEELLDMHTVRSLIETRGVSFGRPWFGQLMRGPQLIAYLLQLELWMREYNVVVEL
jgi:asparagine synthase (glutamine-hydrolysing)